MTYSSLFSPVLGFHPENVEISNSEIQNYKDCKRKWYFLNYLGLQKEEKLFGPLALGTLVHSALEKYYSTYELSDLTDEYTRESNKLIKLFEKSDYADDDEYKKKFYQDTIELGRIMIEGYREMIEENGYDASVNIKSVEEKLEYKVLGENDNRVTLVGKLDARVQRKSDGSFGVIDHKTVASANWAGYFETSGSSEQFLHYNILELMSSDGSYEVNGGIYNLLKKTKRTSRAKPPFYDRLDIRFTGEQLSNFFQRTLATVGEMIEARNRLDAGENLHRVAYPHITKDCSWKCPMYQYCVVSPMIDDSEPYGRYEDILADNFTQVDPMSRYNVVSDDGVIKKSSGTQKDFVEKVSK